MIDQDHFVFKYNLVSQSRYSTKQSTQLLAKFLDKLKKNKSLNFFGYQLYDHTHIFYNQIIIEKNLFGSANRQPVFKDIFGLRCFSITVGNKIALLTCFCNSNEKFGLI